MKKRSLFSENERSYSGRGVHRNQFSCTPQPTAVYTGGINRKLELDNLIQPKR